MRTKIHDARTRCRKIFGCLNLELFLRPLGSSISDDAGMFGQEPSAIQSHECRKCLLLCQIACGLRKLSVSSSRLVIPAECDGIILWMLIHLGSSPPYESPFIPQPARGQNSTQQGRKVYDGVQKQRLLPAANCEPELGTVIFFLHPLRAIPHI